MRLKHNGLIGRRLVTTAQKKRASVRLDPSQRLFVDNTEEREGVREITAVVH